MQESKQAEKEVYNDEFALQRFSYQNFLSIYVAELLQSVCEVCKSLHD